MLSEMGKQWQGKKWYCYGTSQTDNKERTGKVGVNPDNQPNCPNKTGYYSDYLAELAGLEQHNFGKGASGIVPALHGDDSIKSRVMTLADGKLEADLITVEVIPNDAKAELGEVTDWSDDTFCGNLNQILAYLAENTRAFIAVLIAARPRYAPFNAEERLHPHCEKKFERYAREAAVEQICRMHGIPCWNAGDECNMGYFRIGMTREYVQDQGHLTEEGGKLVAQYYWSKLQCVYPIK